MEELEELLITHDWYYQYSDDPRIYNKGFKEAHVIKLIMNQYNNNKEVTALYNKYKPIINN